MKRIYKRSEEDELWCDYGDAFSAICERVEKQHPQVSKTAWGFHKAYITPQSRGYSVNAVFTCFDRELKSIVLGKVRTSS